MSMRTLLVPVTGGENAVPVIGCALKLAARFKSHLTALHVRPDPRSAIPFIGEGLTAEVVQDLCAAAEREGNAQAKIARALFDRIVKETDVPVVGAKGSVSVSWDEHVGFFAERLGRQARLSDLTLVPQPGKSSGGPGENDSEFLNEVLFRSGRPLLLVPADTPNVVGKRVLVAWNGRAECARSVAAALPILTGAEAVTLVTIGDENEERPSLDALAEYLARHGIDADKRAEPAGKDSISAILLGIADETGADMLVMGAYSHNRWREMVIGGVTRHIIDRAGIPVFMSH